MAPSLNIVIPVYRGRDHIAATLNGLAGEVGPRTNVAVVINGPPDGSDLVASGALSALAETGALTYLVRLEAASRTGALSAGEALCDPAGHWLYLDQDVLISRGGVRAIRCALNDGSHFVCASAKWRSSSRLVGAAMEAWNTLPYVVGGAVTAGMYALSAEGRNRWSAWPTGVPDDKFARLNFEPGDRRRLDDVFYSACAPSTFGELVAARERYARSNAALRTLEPQIAGRESGRGWENLKALASGHLAGFAVLATAELLAQRRCL